MRSRDGLPGERYSPSPQARTEVVPLIGEATIDPAIPPGVMVLTDPVTGAVRQVIDLRGKP